MPQGVALALQELPQKGARERAQGLVRRGGAKEGRGRGDGPGQAMQLLLLLRRRRMPARSGVMLMLRPSR